MSATLIIAFNIKEKTLVFSGDTFVVRDRIKSLGKSNWDSVSKTWLVRGVELGVEEVQNIFPHADISVSSASQAGEIIGLKSRTILNKPVRPPLDFSNDSLAQSLKVDSKLENDSLSVSSLLTGIKRVISTHFPTTIRIYGILNSVKILSNGRCYFDLIDSKTSGIFIRCVLWENKKYLLEGLKSAGIELEDNIPILLEAGVSLNQKNAQVSLNVEGFVPEYTLGKLQASREQTNNRLKEEKIFQQNKEKSLKFLPIRLGLITSDAGTVINDFLASLNVCNFGFKLYWYRARVQGKDAERDIIDALNFLQNKSKVDAILIFRGGGSVTDLAVFNEYNIAKAICECALPVFSAIGHEYDQSSTQDVSFKSFGVPKDIGRFFSDLIISRTDDLNDVGASLLFESHEIVSGSEKILSVIMFKILKDIKIIFTQRLEKLRNVSDRIRKNGSDTFQAQNSKLENLRKFISKGISETVLKSEARLGSRADILLNQGSQICKLASMRLLQHDAILKKGFEVHSMFNLKLEHLAGIINSFSPTIQLERGYAIVRDSGNRVLKGIRGIEVDQVLTLEMAEGKIEVNVNKIEVNVNEKEYE